MMHLVFDTSSAIFYVLAQRQFETSHHQFKYHSTRLKPPSSHRITMSQQDRPETKPIIGSPSTPGKKSSSKPPLTTTKSPVKLPPAEMQRGKILAMQALMDFAVKGSMVEVVAEKVRPRTSGIWFAINGLRSAASSVRPVETSTRRSVPRGSKELSTQGLGADGVGRSVKKY